MPVGNAIGVREGRKEEQTSFPEPLVGVAIGQKRSGTYSRRTGKCLRPAHVVEITINACRGIKVVFLMREYRCANACLLMRDGR